MTTDLQIPAASTSSDRRWLGLVVIAVAQLMVALDATIVNIALPSAQHALRFGDADRQWVVTAYTLSFAGLLLLGGRIADNVGRRRVFLGGLVGFAAASALAGAAPNFAVLIAGRALQGGFAAMLAPAALSLIAVTFTEPRERGKAFGVYGAVASSGAAAGLLLGGALTEYLDWRWCLYVNVLVAIGAVLAGRAVLPHPPAGANAGIDIAAGVLATGSLAAIVYGCSQAVPHGWSSVNVLAPLAAGALGAGLFVVRQAGQADPLLPLSIVTNRARAGAYLAVAAAVVGSFGTFLMLTYDFQVVLGYSPVRAGLAFLPLTAAVSVSSFTIASRVLPHAAPRVLIAPGLLVASAGLILLSRMDPATSFAGLILPAEILLGLGMGAVFTPAITVATTGVDMRHAGVAAAVANTAMQIGGSIGTAVLNTVAITSTRHYLGTAGMARGPFDALVHGYGTATLSAAGLLIVVAAIVLAIVDTPAPRLSELHS